MGRQAGQFDVVEAEVAALAATLPEAEATLIRESAKALRTQPEASLDSALSPALAKYWSQSLRAKVRSALQDLAKAKPADEGN